MTDKETLMILSLLNELFPQGAKGTESRARIWHSLLEECDFRIAWQAAVNVAKTWEGYTMPPPATLLKEIDRLTGNEQNTGELWSIGERAIKGSVSTPEDFQKLPEALQRYFGSLQTIRSLGSLPIEQLGYERTRFLKEIGNIQDQIRAERLLPENTQKAMIEYRTSQEVDDDEI